MVTLIISTNTDYTPPSRTLKKSPSKCPQNTLHSAKINWARHYARCFCLYSSEEPGKKVLLSLCNQCRKVQGLRHSEKRESTQEMRTRLTGSSSTSGINVLVFRLHPFPFHFSPLMLLKEHWAFPSHHRCLIVQ